MGKNASLYRVRPEIEEIGSFIHVYTYLFYIIKLKF